MSEKILYTITDEAPRLATFSLLPIIQKYCNAANVKVETTDISLAGRIIANFPEYLTEEQRQPDDLKILGKLVNTPDCNIIKLPCISASIPQINKAIKELNDKGYKIPEYPEVPSPEYPLYPE